MCTMWGKDWSSVFSLWVVHYSNTFERLFFPHWLTWHFWPQTFGSVSRFYWCMSRLTYTILLWLLLLYDVMKSSNRSTLLSLKKKKNKRKLFTIPGLYISTFILELAGQFPQKCLFLFLFFFWPHLWHVEVPRPGIKPAVTMLDP